MAQILGWRAQELPGRRKGDPRQVKVAARLIRETTMTLVWIAERLHMGAPGHVSNLLHRNGREAKTLKNPDGKKGIESEWF
jgi:hypothetical protein